MGKQLVITEKPSVARDIAAALGGFSDGKGDWLESDDYVVTWAIGHLLELAEPKEYDTKWRSWSIKNLPIIPEQFEIRPRDGQKQRIAGIKKLGKRKDIDGLINACDAGREGELIFRRVVEYTGLDKQPHQRLWLQSMTKKSIVDAFDNLKPGSQLDTLGDAAWLRAVGDWLVGMNATRALTQRLKSRGERGSWSAGRVQTPTLNLMVQREREILAHEPRDYWVIEGDFTGGAEVHTWLGRMYDDGQPAPDDPEYKAGRIFEKARAEALMKALKAAPKGTATEKRRKSKQNPPLPFDLTSLQREANKRYSMSARRTLDAAQRLYEGHKLLTYPRTDSRYLPEDYGPTVTDILTDYATLKSTGPWGELAALAGKIGTAGPQNMGRILDSSKVSDHFAIVPTGTLPGEELHGDDLRIYELVMRQFFAALMGPATFDVVERIVDVEIPDQDKPARFRTSAKSLEVPGFLEALGQQAGQGSKLPSLVPGDKNPSGVVVDVTEVREEQKQTRPPGRFSEAQLLRMMETAGELIEDDELSEAMQGRGLGTPATRADTIERLVRTQYARRVEGRLAPTSKAMRLMDILERVDAAGLASAKLTGEWQYQLDRVEKGEIKRKDVEKDLAGYTRAVIESLVGFEHENLYDDDPAIGTCPECGGKVGESAWGYPCENNTGKDSECSFMIWKDRNGRYIDRKLAGKLIKERTIGPVDGFVARGSRRFSSGILKLVQDKEAGRWNLDIQWGDEAGEEEEEVVGDPIFDCPVHDDCKIMESNLRYVCQKRLAGEDRKGPLLPKLVCQREMAPAEIEPYFSEEGKTETMGGFISRRGREFKGLLFRKPTGKHGFEFPPREKKGKGKKKPAVKKPAAKKATTKKAAAKKKPAAKKASTAKKKPARKKSTAKKATTKKTAAKKKTEGNQPAE